MAINLTTSQKVMVTAQGLDAANVQVNFPAPPLFALSDATLATLVDLAPTDPQPPAGQVAMWLVSTIAGSGTLSVSADAVPGDDTTKITGTLDFVIAAPVDLLASINVVAGVPAPK